MIIGVPGLSTDANNGDTNLLKGKIYLFGGIMIFQLLLKSMYKLRYRCKADLKSLINEAILTGILAVIGFSIFIDLINMKDTRDMIVPYLGNNYSQTFVISSIISLFILLAKVVEIIITGKKEECVSE